MYFKSILFLVLYAFGGSLVAQDDPVRREVQKLIRYETDIRYQRTPGFIIAMLEKDTTFIFSFGQRSARDHHPLVKEDVFEIGGVSKLYTALITMQLVDRGVLDLRRSVNDYMEIPNPSLDSCTIVRLLTHTSGFPKYPAGWGSYEKEANNPFAHFTPEEAGRFLDHYRSPVISQPEYLYSHLNYVTLQWLLTKVTGKAYEDLLQEAIQPYQLQASTRLQTTVPGYGFDVKEKSPWTSTAYSGSIGIKASLNELILFCRWTLNRQPDFFRLLSRAPMQTGKNKGWVGLGWQVLPIPMNRFVYAHTGRTEGHHCFVGLLPETGTAVIILSNSATGTDPLGLSILNMMNQNWKRK